MSHEDCCPATCFWKRLQGMTFVQHAICWYLDRYASSYSIVWRMPKWKYKDKK